MAALFNHKKNNPEPDPTAMNKQFMNDSQLLHALVDNIPDFIYIKDRNSKFVLANRKLASSHGLKSGMQMIGKTDHDYYPKELANKYYWNEQEIISNGKPMISLEEKSLNEKGEEIYLSTTKIPLKDNQGNVIGVVGIGRDITDRKRAEISLIENSERLQHLNTLLEEKQEEIQQQAEELTVQADNLNAANQELQKLSIAVSETDNVVILLDAEGNLEWANKSFTRVYGVTLEEYIKKKGKSILEGSFNPDIQKILEKCRKNKKTISYESEAEDQSGNMIWVQSSLTPVQDTEGKIIQFVSIDTDITALKMAQDLINRQREELEARGLQLEKANTTKDKFISIIAHDLKNPLHSILGFSDLLVRNMNETKEEKMIEYLHLINESSTYANELLENLLGWSRTQSDRISYEPGKIELNPVADNTFHILHASVEKKNLKYENLIPKGIYAHADPNMIQTILRNLLSNAIKFTADGGSISISAKEEGERIVVYVKDTGTGIDPDLQEKLLNFGEFHTTPGTRGEQGTGLGLVLIQEFIQKHGGSLKLSSEVGKGSTFYFDLPASLE